MLVDAPSFEKLAARFERLGPADRRAVLARLDAEDRRAFERRLAARAEEERRKLAEERRADRQFVRYSPALAAKVELAVRGNAPEESVMTPACAAAIARIHAASEETTEPGSLERILGMLGLAPLLLPNAAVR